MNESDFNEHTTPSGGWQYRQPEVNWTIQHPVSKTLNQVTMEVVAMRKKNPVQIGKFKWATNYEAVKSEVLRFNRKRLGLSEEATPLPFQESRSPSLFAAAGAAVDDLKRAASGTAVVLDWLRSGGAPVAQELANKRAAICVECPNNVEGSWFTVAPAQLIKETLEARKDLKLETPHDAKLKSCGICKCLLALKCHTPLEFIIAKTNPAIMAEFPAHCWIQNRDA